jgi:hypothetical protein
MRKAAPLMIGDDRHIAFIAGYELGKAERLEIEIDDQVQQALHARACEMLGLAQHLASVKGPAWTEQIRAAGEDQ